MVVGKVILMVQVGVRDGTATLSDGTRVKPPDISSGMTNVARCGRQRAEVREA